MARFSKRQYQQHVLVAMGVYTALITLGWPLVRSTHSVPLKVLLAVTTAMPVIYVMVQLVRLIRDSDELERFTHLVALSSATAVVCALSLIGGFLSVAGVVKLDGSVLIWVYPAMAICYALVHAGVRRRYGIAMWCDEVSAKQYVWISVLGIALLALALVCPHWLDDQQCGVLCGMGAVFVLFGIALAAVYHYRRKYRGE